MELLPPNRHRVMWAMLLGLEFDQSQMINTREMQQKEAKINTVSGIVFGKFLGTMYSPIPYELKLSRPSFEFICDI